MFILVLLYKISPYGGYVSTEKKMWISWNASEKRGAFLHNIKGGSNESNCIKNVHGRQKLQQIMSGSFRI